MFYNCMISKTRPCLVYCRLLIVLVTQNGYNNRNKETMYVHMYSNKSISEMNNSINVQ